MSIFSRHKKNIYPNMAPVVNNYIQAVRDHFSAKKFYIVQQKVNGDWFVLRIRRGNWFSGFFGLNHDVRLSVNTKGDDMETEIRTAYLRLHFMLLLFFLMLIPPLIAVFLGTLHILFLFWVIFFILHLVGFLRQNLFAKKIRKYTELFCKNNETVKRFCPKCGKQLDPGSLKCLFCGSPADSGTPL